MLKRNVGKNKIKIDFNKIVLYIPKQVKFIISTLKDAGYDAYIVGGCVRDELLKIKPSDFDVTTNAMPQVIKKLFKKTIDTGIKHGTVSVLFYENNKPKVYEVTTYRIDGKYEDGRHPNTVTFVDDLKEDLRRRDFTVNAMAYSDETGLVDEFGGLYDLKNKIIRAVGDPKERFTEDALRLMRAIRFAAKLGFVIDKDTIDVIPMLAKNLSLVSKERVQVELTKILISDNPDYVDYIFSLGLSKYICDGFDNIKRGNIEPRLSIYLAYACLFYNEDAKSAYQILRRLKMDNKTTDKVQMLLDAKIFYYKMRDIYNIEKEKFAHTSKKKDINKFINLIDEKIDIIVKQSIDFLHYDLVYDFIKLLVINEGESRLIALYEEKVRRNELNHVPIFINDLDINGKDLVNIGFIGEEVGHALKNLQGIIHNYPKINQKKLLQDVAKKAYNIYKNQI